MRLIALLVLVFACACAKEEKITFKAIDAAPRPDAEAAPPPVPAPTLEPVEGASAENGKRVFLSVCAGCHGADGKTVGPQAEGLPIAPTDLTSPKYLCRSTVGAPVAVPSDLDIETAIERGTHARFKEIVGLDKTARRSLTLFLKTLSSEFNRPPQPLLAVPAEPADTPESRRRGRIAYLAFGCWRCHGTDGKGQHATAPEFFAWNGRPLAAIKPLLDETKYLCGGAPERVYRTVALGLGSGLMPAYQEMAELVGQPESLPKDWGKSLEGKVEPDEIKAVVGWYGQLPEMLYVRGMSAKQKRERAGQFLWDIVHYVRSL